MLDIEFLVDCVLLWLYKLTSFFLPKFLRRNWFSLIENSLHGNSLLITSLNLCYSLGSGLLQFYNCKVDFTMTFQILLFVGLILNVQKKQTNKQTGCCPFKFSGSCFKFYLCIFNHVGLFLVSCNILSIKNSIHLLCPHTRSLYF